VTLSLTPAMDISNLWFHCYRFTLASFHTVKTTWLTVREAGTSVGQGGRKKVEGNGNLRKKLLPITRPVTREGRRGLVFPGKNFAPPWINVLGIV